VEFKELEEKLKADWGRASVDKRHPWRYPVFATADGTQPQQRIVVLRKFIPAKWEFWFYTDYRSQKISDLKENPAVALHFYHPRQQIQVRLQGRSYIEFQNELSASELATLPENQRSDYQSALAPGSPLTEDMEEGPAAAADHFCVLRFEAQALDYLKLSREGHFRAKGEEQANGSWEWMEVQA
jgi:hypothetical protein